MGPCMCGGCRECLRDQGFDDEAEQDLDELEEEERRIWIEAMEEERYVEWSRNERGV